MKSSVKTKIIILIILVASLIFGWLYFRLDTAPPNKIRNVLIISLDTVRADICSCYNDKLFKHFKDVSNITTPNIDALAAEGVLFERAYAPLSLTLASHCTMLTGTIPPYHGVHDNEGYKLSQSNVTLAEILKNNGFATGAIVGTLILDSKYGMDQGFDFYDDNFQNERAPILIFERQGEEVERIACQWLDEHQKENMFLFLHFYDPHLTYDAPEPYKHMFLDNPNPGPDYRKVLQNYVNHLQGLYAGEVAYTDNCIKGVIEKLKQLGLYESTLIIITSDHGEMLYQHEERTHGYYIYEGNVRIPLIFKVPGAPKPRRIEKTVGLVDIVPTVCSLLGIEGEFEFQGADISPYLLEDDPENLKRHVYLESMTPTKYKANSLLGIVNDNYKYIQTTRPELYDIANNDQEDINLVDKFPKITHRLKEMLEKILKDMIATKSTDNKMEPDNDIIRQLETLGYVSGTVTEDYSFDTSKIDPKDLIGYHVLNKRIGQFMAVEDFDEVREICNNMIAIQPEVHIPYFKLATIASRFEDYPESIKQLKLAIEKDPKNIKIHNFLATVYLEQENYELAIKQLEKSIEINPKQFGIYSPMSHIYYKQKNYEQAFNYAQKSLSINPEEFALLNILGDLYNKQKKPEKAIECFNESLQIAPKQSEVMSKLAMVLYGQGKVAKAIPLWSDSLEIDPNQPYAANSLAWIKATSKNEKFFSPPKALTLAQRACELTEYKDPSMLDTLAAALAANEQFDKAVETADKAIKLAKSTDQNELAQHIQHCLDLYKTRKALRQ